MRFDENSKDKRGRGAGFNPDNRFEKLSYRFEAADLFPEEEKPLLRTEFFRDHTKTIVTENNSPDVGFQYSVNPYRGCEHGCAYCYARPSHEFLSLSAGLDFESKIFVKEKAPELLQEKLSSRGWTGELIFMSGITDCYQPIERKLEITRRCLEVLVEFKNPFSIITKNALVTRDKEIIAQNAKLGAAAVCLSVTSLDSELARVLEPRTSSPQARLRAIRELVEAGIPTGINIAPIIPGLNDHEVPAILKAAHEAGATSAGYTLVRLPLTVRPIFENWLETTFPLKKNKVLNLIRDLRGGRLNDPAFGSRMRGQGPVAAQIRQLFKIYSRKYHFNEREFSLTSEHFRRPTPQMSLLDL